MLLFGFALNFAITAVQPMMHEAYPTAIRNTGVSWCQAFARFGGSASSIVLGGIAGMALFQTAAGTTNWSMVVLVLIVPFVLGFVCCVLFAKETVNKTMDQDVYKRQSFHSKGAPSAGRVVSAMPAHGVGSPCSAHV